MRVLVVEDNPVDFRLVERALGDSFALSHASTLAAGLEVAAREHFDLVVLDLSLDDSRGYETFERANRALSRVPILVLSGLDDDELALRAVSNGAQDFIRKARLLECPLDRIALYAIERRRAEECARNAEQQYRALLDNLPTPAYRCDRTGAITYYNVKAVELWGRAPDPNEPGDRFCGPLPVFAVDGTPVPHHQGWMAQAIHERRGFKGREILIELPGGERRPFLANANPVVDETGGVEGAINVLVDISSQRQAEREARESARFAHATVNSLAAHIAILDHTGTIISVNTAWQRFAAESGTSVMHAGVGTNYLTVCDHTTGDDAETARAASAGIRAVLRGERQVFDLEYPCHAPDEERWFSLRATPFDGDGPTRVVVSRENITSRKIAERLTREQCGLREAVAGMEQVLGVVGHELRTPLAALRAITEYLLTDGARDTAEADRFLAEMSDEVDRMSDTVNNLLEAARLNSGRAVWNWSEVDVADVAEDAVSSVRPLTDAERVRLSVHIDPSVGRVLGDVDAIRRLLVNLLSNARKHTAQGWIDVRGRRYTDPTGAWVEVVVEDTGSGIPPEVAARLGEAFALNVGVVGSNCIGGTGLGLAICKGIAQAHGGELLIESLQGRGTIVTARLRADLRAAACGDTVRAASPEEVAA